MYTVVKLIKRVNVNFEGVIMKDERGKEYISSGVMKWEATPKRMEQYVIVNSIDKEKFLGYWNKYFPYSKLTF